MKKRLTMKRSFRFIIYFFFLLLLCVVCFCFFFIIIFCSPLCGPILSLDVCVRAYMLNVCVVFGGTNEYQYLSRHGWQKINTFILSLLSLMIHEDEKRRKTDATKAKGRRE